VPATTENSKKWLTLAAVCTGVFMLLLDVTIVNVALPDIQSDLKASLSGLQWVIDAYALTLAAFLLTAGSIADIIGRKRVFLVGIVAFTIGSALCGVAQSITVLSLSRGAQGIGGAIMFATSLALLAQAFPPKERGVAFGVFGAVTGVSVAIGPVLGGALTSGLSWRWIFFVNIPVGLAALAVTVVGVDESRAPGARKRIDWAGCVAFSAALALLVYGLIRSHPDGWGATNVWGCLAAAGVLMLAFVQIERSVPDPMFDFALLRVPTFNGGLVAAWAISASMFSLLTYLVIYLQGVLGYSAVEAGVRFLPFTAVIFVTAAVAGRLSDVVPVRLLITPGFVLVGAGLVLMRGADPADGWTHFVPGFIVAGIGTGLINVPLASTAVGVVPPAAAGMASGINSTFRQIGIATGVAFLGSILASSIKDSVVSSTSGTLGDRAAGFAQSVSSGQTEGALRSLPLNLRGQAAEAASHAYASALDDVLLVGSVIAFAAAVLAFVLIRSRDFHREDAAPTSLPVSEMAS
jgi:EmrB/QacA subfamily drug resistance transporter